MFQVFQFLIRVPLTVSDLHHVVCYLDNLSDYFRFYCRKGRLQYVANGFVQSLVELDG